MSDEKRDQEITALMIEVPQLLAEWRSTCALMGLQWRDQDAASFVTDALRSQVAAMLADAWDEGCKAGSTKPGTEPNPYRTDGAAW